MQLARSLWMSFKTIYGPAISIISLISSFAFWIFTPDAIIKMKYVIPFLLLFIIFVLTLVNAYINSLYDFSPRILYSKKISTGGKDTVLLLTEPSNFFPIRALVSIYHKIGEFEITVCLGCVQNIQADGRIQIVIIDIVDGHEDVYEQIANSDKFVLENILIKPFITDSMYTR